MNKQVRAQILAIVPIVVFFISLVCLTIFMLLSWNKDTIDTMQGIFFVLSLVGFILMPLSCLIMEIVSLLYVKQCVRETGYKNTLLFIMDIVEIIITIIIIIVVPIIASYVAEAGNLV